MGNNSVITYRSVGISKLCQYHCRGITSIYNAFVMFFGKLLTNMVQQWSFILWRVPVQVHIDCYCYCYSDTKQLCAYISLEIKFSAWYKITINCAIKNTVSDLHFDGKLLTHGASHPNNVIFLKLVTNNLLGWEAIITNYWSSGMEGGWGWPNWNFLQWICFIFEYEFECCGSGVVLLRQ